MFQGIADGGFWEPRFSGDLAEREPQTVKMGAFPGNSLFRGLEKAYIIVMLPSFAVYVSGATKLKKLTVRWAFLIWGWRGE